ncbi:hypothetical protein HPB50_000864 [Hyalomma asiaticum]|uniref:Uncharacterized protein n=1 Tax=Hyalomma asiaticum TaxID=266040 RepID=A0ACB7SCM1_HYAAI|nr:hypothetical protein HPB50_000864 [Hyalomma asiaticum]
MPGWLQRLNCGCLVHKEKQQQKQDSDEAHVPGSASPFLTPPVSEDELTRQSEYAFQCTDDDLGALEAIVKKPGKVTKPGWKNKIRETFQRSSRPAKLSQSAASVDGQVPSTSYERSGLTFTRDVSPPRVLQQGRKPWSVLMQEAAARRRRVLEESREDTPDPPYSLILIATSDKTEFSFSRMFSLRNLVFGKHMLRVDDIPRMMKLNMRVSATFQEIWTVFFKTQSLLTWEDPGATSGLVMALLALIGLATWKGQAFVVQFTVTAVLLKLFVVDHVLYLFPEAAKYDPISRAWDRLPVHPVEDS